jgi:hypothetical protein
MSIACFVGALGEYLDVFQEKNLFEDGEKLEKNLHSQTMNLEQKQFAVASLLQKKRYLLQTYNEFEEHFQQLNTDLVDYTKENG